MSPGTGPFLLLLFYVGSAIISLASAQDPTVGMTCPDDVFNPTCDDPSVVFTDECTVDQDCDGNRKCCFSGCRRRCRQPLGAKDNPCPYFEDSKCTFINLFSGECLNDDQCQGTDRCCLDNCIFNCMPTVKGIIAVAGAAMVIVAPLVRKS